MKKVLSLFSGCGGMDLGFEGGFTVPGVGEHMEKLGFETVFACDIKKTAAICWEARFGKPDTFHLESVVDMVKRHRDEGGVFPEADVVTGGFPCQDFSVSGKRKGFSSDKGHHGKKEEGLSKAESRGMLYAWMKEVVGIVGPKVFVAENVKGLASMRDAMEIITKDFRQVGEGYVVVPAKTLKAIEYGVPQTRERVIFLGFSRKHLASGMEKALLEGGFDPYPPRTHGQGRLPVVTAGQAFRGLVEPEMSDDPSQRAFSGARYYGDRVQGQKEVFLGEPGPTIRSEHHGNIEFRRLSENNGGQNEIGSGLRQRRLTVRECARLQTFPDDMGFVMDGISATKAYQLIGNAVPPLLAYRIASWLMANWTVLFGEKG